MNSWFTRIGRAMPALLAVAVAWQAPAHAEYKSADPVVVTMTTPPVFYEMSLSPDGKHLAAIGYSEGNAGLFLLDAQTLHATLLIRPRYTFGGILQPRQAIWIGSDLIVASLNDGTSVSLDLEGHEVASFGAAASMRLSDQPGAPETVLSSIDTISGRIHLANPRTGQRWTEDIGLDDVDIVRTVFDANGVPRWAETRKTANWRDDTTVSYWYRSDARSPWQLMDTMPVTGDGMRLLGIEPESGLLIVSSRRGRDTYAVFHYDPRSRQQLDLMAGSDTQDLVADVDNALVRGVLTRGLKPTPVWLDPQWARVQKTVDAALPDHVNLLSGRADGRVLVFSYSDTDPGRWLMLDTAERTLWEVAVKNPAIDPARMRKMETLRYAAPDGLSIPAYLTRPEPSASGVLPPLVVLVHGGPAIRDDWSWNEEVQILAAHGYAVFQPQFRGSTGFGRKFEDAGLGEWGLAMQDDITAGVQYLIDQKAVDPRRICIVGASYGGYAALWGLAKTPQLYRCGISIAGVTDIELMLTDRSDKNFNRATRQWQRERIGDPEADKAHFDQVSPLKHADRIQAPVLLIHGTDDARVPILHGQKMRDALKDHGKQVEWLSLYGAGHGFYRDQRQRVHDSVLDFLGRNLPAATTP